MKKKILFFLMLLFILCVRFFPISLAEDERRRVFVLGRVGFAASQLQGAVAAIGAETRVIGRLYGRLVLCYTACRGSSSGDEDIDYALGANLYVLLKIPLSEILDFIIQAGGGYTAIKKTVVIPGASFSLLDTDRDASAGLSFRYQLSNRTYLDAGGTIKYLLGDVPKIWFTCTIGIAYRIR